MIPGQEFALEGLAEPADAVAVARDVAVAAAVAAAAVAAVAAAAVAAVVAAVAEAAAAESVGLVESWWNEQGKQADLRVELGWVDLGPRCACQTCPVHIHAASARCEEHCT